MKPRDVLIGTAVGGSLIGVVFMALGGLFLAAAWSNAPNGSYFGVGLVEGSVFFSVGSSFLLLSAILIPSLRAIRESGSERPGRNN